MSLRFSYWVLTWGNIGIGNKKQSNIHLPRFDAQYDIPMITAYLLVRDNFFVQKIEQKITIVMPILTVVGVDLLYEHGSLLNFVYTLISLFSDSERSRDLMTSCLAKPTCLLQRLYFSIHLQSYCAVYRKI